MPGFQNATAQTFEQMSYPDEPALPWREVAPSTATLRPSPIPRGAERPAIVTPWDRRLMLPFSGLEGQAAYVLMARPDCLTLHEQPARVAYRDYAGAERHHTFDLLMTQRSGGRIAVAVKPHEIAKKAKTKELLTHIASQMDPKFATGVLLLTEVELSPCKVANATLIHHSRRDPDPALDRVLHAAASQLSGATTIDGLINLARLTHHDQGFYTVARAIGDGSFELLSPGRIGRQSWVRYTGANTRLAS
ncbi:hypothetical protein AB4099_29575 [Bosea sp. 2KB_26]|uniref:hypothetical protein n=1 Tax=Bosea sp. 2KB_26 TaxID=3237475 RepID=UPI003F935F48